MIGEHAIRVNEGQRVTLVRDWTKLFKRFKQAHQRCRTSLSERNVHQLRLAGRQCLPVLEVLRALDPDDPLWAMAHHGLRGLLRILGPLRDAQVRHLRLKALRHSTADHLIQWNRGEEDAAQPGVRAALALFVALPRTRLKTAMSGGSSVELDRISRVLTATLAHRRRRLERRWSAIHVGHPPSLHRARTALKRYRYLLLAMEPCLNARQRKRLPRLKELQGHFGDWHDEQLFRDWLREAGKPAQHLRIRFDRRERVQNAVLTRMLRQQRRTEF